jgi:sorbose reductase
MPLFKPADVNTPVLSQFSLAGKVAVVTGGARGIGVEIVRGLAEAGADVAMLYTSSKDAPQTAANIAAATGVRVQAFQCNVADRADVFAVVGRIVGEFSGSGRLDIMVANAGVCADVPALEYTEETWRRNNSVNLDGVMWTAQAAGEVFKRQGKGNLIVTSSVSSTLVNVPQRQAAYNASKAAATHLAKCLAVEWADFARVNCISPGFIMTESKCGGDYC